jgi:hypothetical protein
MVANVVRKRGEGNLVTAKWGCGLRKIEPEGLELLCNSLTISGTRSCKSVYLIRPMSRVEAY